jgi:UDP-glucose 4-epimerase
MKIVVTGASGFLGGITLLWLRQQGHEVIGIDRRVPSVVLREAATDFYVNDYASVDALRVLVQCQPDAIVHIGASSLVAPSMTDPSGYYHNNVSGTKQILDVWHNALPHSTLVFSSSSSVYGEPRSIPCRETDACAPVSPYGASKLMAELMIQHYAKAYGLRAVIFRYFNVCGADPWGRHGQETGATHIIARCLESINSGQKFRLNGDDYDTADGTCVRDHVHVQDVARLQEMACDPVFEPGVYNVGLGRGVSNREVMSLSQQITGMTLDVEVGPRRAGDPSQLVADTSRLNAQGWQPEFDLSDMIKHAWRWYRHELPISV